MVAFAIHPTPPTSPTPPPTPSRPPPHPYSSNCANTTNTLAMNSGSKISGTPHAVRAYKDWSNSLNPLLSLLLSSPTCTSNHIPKKKKNFTSGSIILDNHHAVINITQAPLVLFCCFSCTRLERWAWLDAHYQYTKIGVNLTYIRRYSTANGAPE